MKSIFCHKAKAAPPAANTLRFEFGDQSYSPVTAGVGSPGAWKKCDWFPGNVWDWTNSGTSFATVFENAFADSGNLVTVIAAGDTSSVTDMSFMFRGCASLTSVPLFDTSSVTNIQSMFRGCTSLTSVPLFDTSKVTNIGSMLNGCTKVEGGSLALYQQASSQATPPSNHTDCFKNCGSNTVTGAAELAHIPTSWGGTKEEA